MNLSRFVFIAALALASSIGLRPISADEPKLEQATFGAGCYWCVEAVFQRLNGVSNVEPGFMGGRGKNPTYDQVVKGRTGHAEVVHLKYDPSVISYAKLLEVFWRFHDPTTLNRQGPDVGTQYRSVIFYHTKEQRETAAKLKKQLNRQNVFGAPVVTAIDEASEFYPTKQDHFDFFNNNPENRYCKAYIVPKLKKLKAIFADHLKDEAAK